jgi:hypothetical protein
MSTYKGWEAEEKIAIDYLETCRSAVEDDEVFAKFKSLQGYKNILEHVTPRQGSEYLQLAMEMASDALLENLEAFKENDLIGTPDKFSYPETGKISPTTIRYIKNDFVRLLVLSVILTSISLLTCLKQSKCKKNISITFLNSQKNASSLVVMTLRK